MIDIVYTTFNRLEYATASLAILRDHTNWDLVRRMVVYDDGSTDGTREMLDRAFWEWPCDVQVYAEQRMGPVALTERYVWGGDTLPVFAKIDSDVCVPPGWLEAMLAVLDEFPMVELLGMEAGMTECAGRDGVAFSGYAFEPATNIGGVGLFRTSAFHCRQRMRPDGRNGFTEWQHTHRPTRGWIRPDLPVVLLDRLPFEPWRSLSLEYVARGWQREHGLWDEVWMSWAWEWFLDTMEQAA